MNEQKIYELLKQGEHLSLECKLCEKKLPNSLWESYSAFANAYGGYILLGIEEHPKEATPDKRFAIAGVANPHKLITDFWNLANDTNKVNVNLLKDDDVEVIEIDGKDIIVIHIPRADYHLRPIYINDNPAKGTFRRNHEGDYHCSKGDVASMYRDANDEGNDHVLLAHYTMEDIDAITLREYRQMFLTRNPDHWLNKRDDKEFLIQLGGYRIDRQTGEEGLTMTGLLMFGKGLPIRERFSNIRMDYVDKTNLTGEMRYSDRLTYDLTWENNLFQFITLALPRLTRDLPRPFVLEGMQRTDDTPLHKLVREAFTNMIIHADFLQTGVLRAEKRNDGFYFSNPGTIKLPIERVYQGGLSRSRNPHMQNILRMIGLGENLGTGFPTMVDTWEKQFHVLPKLEEDWQTHVTELTFSGMQHETHSKVENKEELIAQLGEKLGRKLGRKLGKNRTAIIELIVNNPHITYAEIADALSVSTTTVENRIAEMSGVIIQHVGPKKGGHWETIDD